MKLDQLRKIIREEVRAAFKEELKEVLTEAVQIASTPQVQKVTERKTIQAPKSGNKSLDEMLSMTSNTMTSDDYKSIGNFDSSQAKRPNFASSMANQMGMTANAGPAPGIDISQLDFVKSAKSILDASYKKDRKQLS